MYFFNDWVVKKQPTECRYYGTVVDNNDPLKDSRVRIRIPELHKGVPDNVLPFFKPADSMNSNTEKHVDIPAIGTVLEVAFKDDNYYNGYYLRGISNTSSRTDEFFADYPNFKGFKTASGNSVKLYDNGNLIFKNSAGKTLTIVGNMLTWDGDLTVTGNINATEVTASNIPLSKHKHLGVTTGSGTSGLPTT